MTTQPAPAELRELLLAWGEADGAPSARAAMHLLGFAELTDTPGFARHVRVDHVRTAGGLVRCAWIEDWDALIGDRELCLSGVEERMVRLAASLATGRPVSLFADLTRALGPAHAGRIAEAVLIAAGEAGTVTVDGLADGGALHPAPAQSW
jgi:hypothetical protein